jgi:ATP-dependent protease ClpP protease subunit
MSFALILTAFTASPSAAHADTTPHLRAGLSPRHNDILVMVWKGGIQAPMANEIIAAFEEHEDNIRGIELKLDSDGGSVAEGERVIAVLQKIKKTKELHTIVGAGKRCGSMCVFIYVQGQKRLAAPASLWLFHEVSHKDPRTHQVTALDRSAWERLVDKYWVPAGVDQKWIEDVKTHTVGTNYWQSGDSLLKDGANIIQKPLSDEQHRVVRSSAVSISAE